MHRFCETQQTMQYNRARVFTDMTELASPSRGTSAGEMYVIEVLTRPVPLALHLVARMHLCNTQDVPMTDKTKFNSCNGWLLEA